MVMRPAAVGRRQVRLDGIGLAGRMTLQFAALAQALVRLDMRASRYFLQEYLDRFIAFDTFERQRARGFHGFPCGFELDGRAVSKSKRNTGLIDSGGWCL